MQMTPAHTDEHSAVRLSRGDRHRRDILSAIRYLIAERSIAELTVSTISAHAGIARSNFYFYFDSKYAALAAVLAEVIDDLIALTDGFAPRGEHETPTSFVSRILDGAAAISAHHSPVLAICTLARNSDVELRSVLDAQFETLITRISVALRHEMRRNRAFPISEDITTLVRTLIANTAFTLAGDSLYVTRPELRDQSVAVLKQLWVAALWPGQHLSQQDRDMLGLPGPARRGQLKNSRRLSVADQPDTRLVSVTGHTRLQKSN